MKHQKQTVLISILQDNTSSDKDESTGTPGPNSEEPFKVTSSQAKKEISKLHVLKEEYSPEIDDEVKKLVERVTNDILDPAKSESVSEDNRKMDSNETDDYDDVNNNADIDDDGDGSMLRR